MDINKFSTLLRSKFGLEVANMSHPSPKQLRILARLPQARMGDWLAGMHHVLLHTLRLGGKAWTVDFSKHYFLKNERIVYAWRIIIQSANAAVDTYEQDIFNAFTGSPKSTRGEVMEIPLMGTSSTRNGRNQRGKGASTIEGSDNFAPSRLR